MNDINFVYYLLLFIIVAILFIVRNMFIKAWYFWDRCTSYCATKRYGTMVALRNFTVFLIIIFCIAAMVALYK